MPMSESGTEQEYIFEAINLSEEISVGFSIPSKQERQKKKKAVKLSSRRNGSWASCPAG